MNRKRLDRLDIDRINDMFERILHLYEGTAERLLTELETACFAAGLEQDSKKEKELFIILHERPVNFNKVTNFYYKTMLDLYYYRNNRLQNPSTSTRPIRKMPNASGKTKALKAPNIHNLPKI